MKIERSTVYKFPINDQGITEPGLQMTVKDDQLTVFVPNMVFHKIDLVYKLRDLLNEMIDTYEGLPHDIPAP